MFYVYKLINLVNRKIYIGKTNSLANRWFQHKSMAKAEKNNRLYNVIRKYTYNAFIMEVLTANENEEFIYEEETKYIQLFQSNTKEKGYNMGLGGEGNREKQVSEQTRKLYSKRSKEHYNSEIAEKLRTAKKTPEARLNAFKVSRGSNNGRAKLDEQKVLFIRAIYKEGFLNQLEISKRYNIPTGTVNHIISRYTWKHI
jgi:group I intron endonuclease